MYAHSFHVGKEYELKQTRRLLLIVGILIVCVKWKSSNVSVDIQSLDDKRSKPFLLL